MTQIVVVERSFAEPTRVETLSELERRAAASLREHRVTWLRTFAPRDLRRMLCFYAAPDAEAVRITQAQAGVPYDRTWSGVSILPPRRPELPTGYTNVIVERQIDSTVTEAEWQRRVETGAWCMAAHRVAFVESVIAPSQGRAVCVFVAPDAEAVRMVNAQLDSSALRVWSGNDWHAD